MTIKGLLLAGASVCALGMSSAFAASAPNVHVTALRPGHAMVKTAMHRSPGATQTATYAVYTSVSVSSDYMKKTNLLGTFYTLNDSSSVCTPAAKQKVKLSTKKTVYAKLSTGSVTYSEGCPSGPTVFRGTVYDLQSKKAKGKTDTFTDTLSAKVKSQGEKYKFNLVLDVSVAIGS
jgi:hypothetical protein